MNWYNDPNVPSPAGFCPIYGWCAVYLFCTNGNEECPGFNCVIHTT